MIERLRRVIQQYLFAQSFAYLITGVLLSISHHIYRNTLLIYIGHLFIIAAFLILISVTRYKWMHRIAEALDVILSRILLIANFAVGLIFSILDELAYYTQLKIASQALINSLFTSILLAVYLYVAILFYIGVIHPRRGILRVFLQGVIHPRRRIFPLRTIPVRTELSNVLRQCFALTVILTPLFFIAGFFSYFTKAVPWGYFWAVSLSLLCLRIIFSQSLSECRLSMPDVPGIIFLLTILFILAGILYIWSVAFESTYFWALGIWQPCVIAAFHPKIRGWLKR